MRTIIGALDLTKLLFLKAILVINGTYQLEKLHISSGVALTLVGFLFCS